MGNCIAPICSDLYVGFIEKYLLFGILHIHVHWLRYINEVL